jgi:hypothetical protein
MVWQYASNSRTHIRVSIRCAPLPQPSHTCPACVASGYGATTCTPSTLDPTERVGLANLYDATLGPAWTGAVGWSSIGNPSVDPCYPTPWTGLTCAYPTFPGTSPYSRVRYGTHAFTAPTTIAQCYACSIFLGCVCEVHSLKACLVTLVTLVCARSQCSRAPHVFGGARGVRGAGLSP